MKKVISNIKKNRRGFTVVEVIVALTVIIIVSGATLMLVASQANAETIAIQTIEATNIAENAIECFRYANGDVGKFKDTFNSLENMPDLQSEGPEGSYTIKKDGLTVTVSIIIDKIAGNTITVSATNASGKTILGTTTYTTKAPQSNSTE